MVNDHFTTFDLAPGLACIMFRIIHSDGRYFRVIGKMDVTYTIRIRTLRMDDISPLPTDFEYLLCSLDNSKT